MSSVAFVADIHHGVPGRQNDIMWSCRVVREYCKAAKIDTVIILGDMWHTRETLAIDVLQMVADFHEETAEKYDQKWIVFPGNHDMFLRHSWDINSLLPMKKHLTVINDVKLLTLDDRRFWVLPFITFEKSYMKVLSKIENQYEEGDVLLTHIGVRGATLNTCFLLKDWSFVSFERSKFKQIYTGHFHSKQEMATYDGQANLWYPGSPIPFKFDEGDVPHGFFVYDLSSQTHKFVNIWKAGKHFFPDEKAPPQFYTFLDELLESKTEEEVKGNIIRIALQREYTDNEKIKMKSRLVDLGAESVRWWNMAQKLTKTNEEVLTTSNSDRDLFKTWLEIDQGGLKDLEVNILHKFHEDIRHEGDELYSIEEAEL